MCWSYQFLNKHSVILSPSDRETGGALINAATNIKNGADVNVTAAIINLQRLF